MLLKLTPSLPLVYFWCDRSPFEVGRLTENTNWGNVERPSSIDVRVFCRRKIAGYHRAQLELIRPAGYFNVKSARLKDFIAWLFFGTEEVGGYVAGDWRACGWTCSGAGIGPETCDSILLYAGHKPSFVVDAYTKRLFSRLGLISSKASYDEVRDLFMESLPADVELFNEYHALIVEHCKERCRTRPVCGECVLRVRCEYYRKGSSLPQRPASLAGHPFQFVINRIHS
jgi:endonuclease-3 related protein